MTAVKVGDRVRATCGESVIVGTVRNVAGSGVEVAQDGFEQGNFFAFEGWAVEVLPPPIPDVVGTIVRDCDGDAWQRYEDGWNCADGSDGSYAHLQGLYGPFTVLWTPDA